MGVEEIARNLSLGSLLDELRARFDGYEMLDHWQRGEFHHDLLIKVATMGTLPGSFLVVAVNCNGGVKEVLCFASPPDESALWHHRCPDAPDFSGELPPLLGQGRTLHWFDPCALLAPDARSEYRPEFRERQPGGGWQLKGCGVGKALH